MRPISIVGICAGVAAAALAVRACRAGSPGTGAPQVPPGDASTSSVADAGPKGRVTVAVFDEGQPMVGRVVVFQNAEGQVVATAKSGADGKASADMHAGGMITVAQGISLHQLVSVMDVQPGDEIIVGEAVDEEGLATTVGSSKIWLPGRYPGAARYGVSLGVGVTDVADPNTPTPLPVLSRFLVDGSKFKAVAEALDAEGEPLAFAFVWTRWRAPPPSKPLPQVDVRLAPWSKEWRTFEVALANAPPGVTTAEGKFSIYSKDEDRFDRNPRRAEIREGAAKLQFHVPPPLGTEARLAVGLAFGSSPDKAAVVRREESMGTTSAIDLGATMLPRVSDAAIDATDDVARPSVRWKVGGDASRADLAIVRASWPATREHVWTIVLPPGAPTRLRLPALPDELAEWRPDGRPTTVGAAVVEASFYASYADARRKGLQLLSEPPEDEEGGVTVRWCATGDLEL